MRERERERERVRVKKKERFSGSEIKRIKITD